MKRAESAADIPVRDPEGRQECLPHAEDSLPKPARTPGVHLGVQIRRRARWLHAAMGSVSLARVCNIRENNHGSTDA